MQLLHLFFLCHILQSLNIDLIYCLLCPSSILSHHIFKLINLIIFLIYHLFYLPRLLKLISQYIFKTIFTPIFSIRQISLQNLNSFFVRLLSYLTFFILAWNLMIFGLKWLPFWLLILYTLFQILFLLSKYSLLNR